MKTYVQLWQEKTSMSLALEQVNKLIEGITYYFLIEAAQARYLSQTLFERESQAELLVKEISNRHWPMTKEEIKKVFINSGFNYEEKHILESRPDTEEYVIKYRGDAGHELHI